MASGLTRWFKEEWVDLSRPKKGGGYEPCGRDDAKSGKYPKCVPAARAAKMTPEQIKSAIARKRKAESTKTREDKKPIMVETIKGDFVGHPFRGNQWTGKGGSGLSNASQVSVGWEGDSTYSSGIYGFSTKGDHPDDADPNDEEGWFPAAVDARLDVVTKVLDSSRRRNGELDKSITSHMLGLNNAAQDVFLSHVGNDMTKGAVANAVKATSGKERDIRKFSSISRIQGARIKVKTQNRKDTEIDSLTDAQYGRYSKAPQTLSHDSAMAYALNPKKFTGIFGASSVQKVDIVEKVSRMSADLWSTGEGGFIGPALGNVVALGEGRKRSDYDSFIETRRRMVKNHKGLKANSYQRERFQKETTGNGRSGGELGRGNNQIRASRKKKMLKEWGSGSNVPCGYCGAKLNYKTLEMEKLVPEIGYDTFENLAPACRKCNASMYSKTFVEKIRMVSKDSPTTSDVHVPAVMGSKKKRDLKKKKMAMDMSLRKGQPLKDPKGGLTAAGRAKFNRETGSNLKPGVKGKADTPEKMKRKGSFLTRFFTNPSGPMVNDKGEPTRLALSAVAWGEPVPKDRSDAAKLAQKGRNLLARYENVTKVGDLPGHKFRGNQWTRSGAGMSNAMASPKGKPAGSPTKGKPRPTAPTKAGQPQIKTRIVSVDARSKAKAEQVRGYMEAPVKKFKNPNVRKYALARVKQMTGGEPRPSGMSKKYNLDKKQVVGTEVVLSKIFRAGREKFKI